MILSKILEKQPDTFLEKIQKKENKEDVTKWVNDITEYSAWYSTGLMKLLYLVGESNTTLSKERIYGGFTTITEDLGIKIFDILIQSNPNLELKDYYGDTFKDKFIEYEKGGGLRKNNVRFLTHIKETIGW
jgi:hypothetical protein